MYCSEQAILFAPQRFNNSRFGRNGSAAISFSVIKGETRNGRLQSHHESREEGYDVCILDTAGRLQTQTNLMQQLDKIRRVIGKQIEGVLMKSFWYWMPLPDRMR